MSKIGVISLGCSKNLVDAEIMIGILKEKGHEIVTCEADAEVIIINTCGFIDQAKEEAISTILEMAEYKEQNLKRLIVTGCLAQRYKDEILKELPEVDVIIGTGRFLEIADAVEGKTEKVLVGAGNAPYPEGAPRTISTPPYTAYLKIAEGCSNNCTYCAIPAIRGPLRSRRMKDIVAEAERLAKEGVTELNVIAQDTTVYGKDIYGAPRLLQLLKKLTKIEGIKWIRVLYTYPELLSDELLSFIAESDKVASYFDIPLQHISDPVLKRMGRKSREKNIYALIEKIRTIIPDATIRTTFIVGFPGETSEDFEKLLSFVKWAKFDKMGAFKYSPEDGTAAAKLKGRVHEDIMDYRYQSLMDEQVEISTQKCKGKIGNIYTVLVEGKTEDGYFGRTACDAPEVDGNVFFFAENAEIGSYVSVEITNAYQYDLIGEMIDEPSK